MLELPFTTKQFLEIFRGYNSAIYPVQILAYGFGLLATALALWKKSFSDKTISTILSIFWLWMGAVYHIAFFSKINQAAYLVRSLLCREFCS